LYIDFGEADSGKNVVSGSYLYYHYMQDDFNDNVIQYTLKLTPIYRAGDVPIEVCKL
jgi:hypothetical protein